ncbi:MAG: phosphomannose isomerase type II C-terminal cupin domain [Candidatus Aquicultorales bacterium]
MLVDKPWGHYKQYALNKTCSVKMLTIESGQETSLHWHNLRTDTWVILDEGIMVQLGDEVHEAHVGDEFYIPSGQVHRLKATKKTARVLEIAFGYSNEDDTHRLADDYGRELKL